MKARHGSRVGRIFADGRQIDEALRLAAVTPSESTRSTTRQWSSGAMVASHGCPPGSYARRPSESPPEKGRAHPSAGADRPPRRRGTGLLAYGFRAMPTELQRGCKTSIA